MRLREEQGLRVTAQGRGSRLPVQGFFPGLTFPSVEFPLRIPSKSAPKGLSLEGWELRAAWSGREG